MSEEQKEVIERLKSAIEKAYHAGKQDALEGLIQISQSDLFSFLHCSIQYALGRQTYITGIVPEQVRTYWKHLSVGQRQTLHRNLKADIARYDNAEKRIGDACDEAEWLSLLSWMQEQLAREPS